jgi:glutamate-1-semialdehyde 2,1-aminomutase
MEPLIGLYLAAAAGVAWSLAKVRPRWQLSRAKHPSLRGHARIASRLARLLPFYEYDEARIFRVDGAPPEVEERRRRGFERLASSLVEKRPRTLALTAEAEGAISDLQFTSAYRVPFQFSRYVRRRLPAGAFVCETNGVMVSDLDGNQSYDLTGSYGVNVFGHAFYKACIERGVATVRKLGPVLGSYHPVVAANVERLRRISGLDEVSFHMSGTEAVMQAVRLARYHTRRSHVVRFCGAYHGWWDDVQPGIGNPLPAHRTYTLREMDEASLRVLRGRRDIACVLVNPLQALHPNASAPSDSMLLASEQRTRVDREEYAAWLARLRAVCTERDIPLVFDEVFVGFRLARGGAQEYFAVRADLVTYGKTLGGGLPVGVLCGRRDLMKRYREERPSDVCFARGTFNSHPYVMGAMDAFLDRLETEEMRARYDGLDDLWDTRASWLNQRMAAYELPVRVANLSSIWSVCYEQPSRYNWMLQYYLRDAGLALSWVGTGRLIFSLDYTDADFEAVSDRFVAAARAMREDGWWWADGSRTEKDVRRGLLREMLAARFSRA